MDALFTELDVRGSAAEGLTEDFAERLGRALGTLARRRGEADIGFVLGREPGEALARVSEGLVRGLVLSGQRVIDVGVVDARRHEFALVHLARPAGVFLAAAHEDEAPPSLTLEILLGGGPLVGAGLRELREIVRAGDFAAGAGVLEVLDIESAFLEAERQGGAPGLGRDTQVG